MSNCFPILGGTSIEQLKSNIKALSIELTPEQMKKLNDGSPFDPGFPMAFFGTDPRQLPNQAPQGGLLTAVSVVLFFILIFFRYHAHVADKQAGHLKYPTH